LLTAIIFWHFEYVEHAQNHCPVYFPFFAYRFSISELLTGQAGAGGASASGDLTVSGLTPELASSCKAGDAMRGLDKWRFLEG